MNTGKLLLKWEDFTEDIRASFHTLRNVHDFTDVTLACEDGVQIEAHKCILAAEPKTSSSTALLEGTQLQHNI
jgi:hypothetical protein